MKRIFGLDLGTNSIGWAVVNEKENDKEKSAIINIGTRVVPLSADEQNNFEKGKPLTTNAEKRQKRCARLNRQRYKLRREKLIAILEENNFISKATILAENGQGTTFETYQLRAKAATQEVTLEELARVLLMINKKRGYKSNRKTQPQEEGRPIDGIAAAQILMEKKLTPGQYSLSLLEQGKKYLPDFYHSDLQAEFEQIWNFQQQFYPEILTDSLKNELVGKNKKQTWTICSKPFGITGIKREKKGEALRKENYEWRAKALSQKMDLEQLAIILQEINDQLKDSSGYLGNISDRSKKLFFNNQTIGQTQMEELVQNPNNSLKNQVFYRQNYLNEFETIWETQANYHKELTPELKHKIRDKIIFYQRPLKSQKKRISHCEFESKEVEIDIDGKKKQRTIGPRACPKSSPLYQEFRLWQTINNVQVSGMVIPGIQLDLFGENIKYKPGKRFLLQDEKEKLFRELTFKERLSKNDILKLLSLDPKEVDLKFKEIKGNTTMSALAKACQTILRMSGREQPDLSKISADEAVNAISSAFKTLGYNDQILYFDSSLKGKALTSQPAYALWHLLYSFEGDDSALGIDKLTNKISELYGFNKEHATVFAKIIFEPDYGSLSAKAIRKILPHMKNGLEFSKACQEAGYRHSQRSLTKEEIANKPLKNHIDQLRRNSLRNPVVEKILNQMINVVNALIDQYGIPDEIRVEMARELKKSAAERDEISKAINRAAAQNEKHRQTLQNEFHLKNVTHNDIIKYKLYLELANTEFKTLYSETFIPQETLFSKDFDIEHIIPRAKLFDDSFANKTIEARHINIEKGNMTAYDFISNKYGQTGLEDYKKRITSLYENGAISRTKYNRLLTSESEIPADFINRDLNDTQYIARKACEILEEVTRTVTTTTGAITDRLREDWQLIDVMKELNWNKYDKLGLTEIIPGKDGQCIRKIKEWTKRNDHRHHAMDALTIAFTKPSYIQYLNNLNARNDKGGSIYGIEQKELTRDSKGKLRFIPPMPLDEFRAEAKRHLEAVLVSIKAKNKVVTLNINKTKTSKNKEGNRKAQLTPRGQLHNETIYGSIKRYVTKEEKIGASFNEAKIMTVAKPLYRNALLKRLDQYNGDTKKAFTGKNSLEKTPVFTDETHREKVPPKVKTVTLETIFTQRKEISKDLKVDKVIDAGIRRLLEERIQQFDGDQEKAFSNLDENPIWLNKEKGIAIKHVTITGVSNAIPLHDKHDHQGRPILDDQGRTLPADYVSTSNNHHVAIFRDAEGNLQEHVVSFFEATTRAIQGLPIIDKSYKKDKGWQFLFTMKQNEYFVFPNPESGFDPVEIDLLNPENYALISPNLFRVQKISTKNYFFRHHLETTVENKKELQGIAWKNIRSLSQMDKLIKVRVNHIGQIVATGEY